VIIGTAVLFLLSISPVSNFLVYYLESQYKPPSSEILSKADIIVILNGGAFPSGGFRKNPEPSGATYSRVFNGVEIFKQSGAKILVMSGANDVKGSEGDAEVMKNLAVALGIQPDKIIVESRSRNTLEHAIELSKIFPPENGMQIGIVTSALHIPRAVQAFWKKYPQDSIIPVPVGYIYSPHGYGIDSLMPSTHVLSQSSYAIHELIDIVLYSLWYN
jgi:uncharacterized SAM-binding protein YcdF (DUF218 family)